MITDYSPDLLNPGDVLLPDSEVPCGHPALATIEEINAHRRIVKLPPEEPLDASPKNNL